MDGSSVTGWEHFDHGADIGVRGRGPTKEEAFVQAALALTAVVADLDHVRSGEPIDVECEAPTDGLLLMDWLNAIVYEMATRRMLFGRYTVMINGTKLTGTLSGERVDRTRHEPAVEVKGATCTSLRVGRELDDTWVAQCVVDV